jgi:hypothetical protein
VKIAEPLQIIFSKSLRQGNYPSSWKIAHVIAILKKGDASLRLLPTWLFMQYCRCIHYTVNMSAVLVEYVI